jgi:hypothetical protein
MTVQKIKELISQYMTDRKKGISVALGESDESYERIFIKYPKTLDYISLNPIEELIRKEKFYVAQILNFMEKEKTWILLVREL